MFWKYFDCISYISQTVLEFIKYSVIQQVNDCIFYFRQDKDPLNSFLPSLKKGFKVMQRGGTGGGLLLDPLTFRRPWKATWFFYTYDKVCRVSLGLWPMVEVFNVSFYWLELWWMYQMVPNKFSVDSPGGSTLGDDVFIHCLLFVCLY